MQKICLKNKDLVTKLNIKDVHVVSRRKESKKQLLKLIIKEYTVAVVNGASNFSQNDERQFYSGEKNNITLHCGSYGNIYGGCINGGGQLTLLLKPGSKIDYKKIAWKWFLYNQDKI